jgi:hypothetical protein
MPPLAGNQPSPRQGRGQPEFGRVTEAGKRSGDIGRQAHRPAELGFCFVGTAKPDEQVTILLVQFAAASTPRPMPVVTPAVCITSWALAALRLRGWPGHDGWVKPGHNGRDGPRRQVNLQAARDQ